VTVAARISEHRLRLEIVFSGIDEREAQAVAAKMIDRAHEIANLPEYECDVDVSVEQISAERHIDPGEQPARARTIAR
jgi:vacuolar-type H+-ATPase subunit D/Vma8